MTLSIVVEGSRDEQLIDAVMSTVVAASGYRVVRAKGKSHAVSVAGTMLTLGDGPVALVIDADTSSEGLLAEQRSDMRALLNRVADPKLWRVVFFVPQIEIALVYDDTVVQRLFGRLLDEVEQALREVAPKKALERLMGKAGWDWPALVERIRKDPGLAELVARAPGMCELVDFAHEVIPNAA